MMTTSASLAGSLALTSLLGFSGCFVSSRPAGGSGGHNTGTHASDVSKVEHGYVSFAVSPSGKEIVFSAADADLYLLDLQTRTVRRLTKTEILETTPAFAPDGKSVVYSAGVGGRNGSHLFTLDLASKAVKPLTSGENISDHMPSYSPDGAQIVFARAFRIRPYSMGGWTNDNYDACIVSRNGGPVRRVTSRSYYQLSRPHFLRDRQTLVYGAIGTYPDTTEYLFTADIATGQPRLLTPKPRAGVAYIALGTEPDVIRSGGRILFISDRRASFAYDLWIMNADGSKPAALNLTHVSRYNQNPVFMPDGKRVLFLAATAFNAYSRPVFSLWQANADGSRAHQLAGSNLFTAPLQWKPGT
jgi:Tol biopolymer transport system component